MPESHVPGSREPDSGMTDGDHRRADVGLLGLLLFATLTVALPVLAPLRGVAVFAAALTVPGAAVLTLLAARRGPATVDDHPATFLALAVAISLAVDTAGSLALVWLHLWHPLVLAAILAIGSAALLSTDLSRRLRTRADAPPSTEARF